jgi:hypothetical protein
LHQCVHDPEDGNAEKSAGRLPRTTRVSVSDGTENRQRSDSRTEQLTSLYILNFRVDRDPFDLYPMRVLTFRHLENSVGSSWNHPIDMLERGRRRNRAEPFDGVSKKDAWRL